MHIKYLLNHYRRIYFGIDKISLSFTSTGNDGVAGVFRLGTGLLDEVNDWVRAPVGYIFHVFEGNAIRKG